VGVVGRTAEDFAVVAVAFVAWSFLFVRRVVALCGREREVGE
jgi:hypothetical protein